MTQRRAGYPTPIISVHYRRSEKDGDQEGCTTCSIQAQEGKLFSTKQLRIAVAAMQGTFIDKVRIYARGGTGGQGSRKLGGVGGVGGDVSVCAVEGSNLRDMAVLKTRRFVAGLGGMGERSSASGRKGKGIVLSVPPGTVVYDQHDNMVNI